MANVFEWPRGPAWLVLALATPIAASAQPVDEIEVVGTPHDQSPTELAQSVSVLSGETLRRLQGVNLGETLSSQLGISSSYFGSGSSRPIIRGLAGARVKIMEDGIDALDVSTISADHAVGVDPLVAEQIEVFRGPTTLLYGSGAVGGVVNTVTNRIPASIDEGIDGAVELRADSAADERSAALRLDGGGPFAWHLDGARRDAGDYDVPSGASPAGTGHVQNSDFDTTSGAAGGTWYGDSASIGAAVSRFASLYGVPVHAHDGEPIDAGADAVRIDLDQTRVDLKAEWLGAGERFPAVTFRLGSSDYRHVELEGGERGTVFDNDAYEGRLEVVHGPWGAWEGAFGAQLGKRDYRALGAEAFVPPVETQSRGLFVVEDRDLGEWQASVGGRVERVRHRPSNGMPAVDETAASVSAAGIRALEGSRSFVVSLALAERAPSAEELFALGPHLASGTYEVGNAALGVETSRHVDVGLRKTDGRIAWAVTAFHTRYEDFIYLADTGTVDAASELPVFAYRQRDAHFTGLEAEAFVTVAAVGAGEIDARLFGDFVAAELDTGESLPRIPPRRLGARLQYHDDRLVAGIEAVRHDDQTDVAPYETPTSGYTLLGIDLDFTLPAAGRAELNVFLRGSNLLDEVARKHTSLVKDVAPLPGRNYSVGFRAAF